MGVSKVVYDGNTLVDLTSDTVTPETLAEGVTAHNAAGEAITGTMQSGGAPVLVMEKDVNFYDYDGTCLYAYTLAEAQALTELPPAPMPPEEFLSFQEWNWTLEQIKTWGRPADVGAIYGPSDRKTAYLRIKIPEGFPLEVPLYYRTWGANHVSTIDWGDGIVDSIVGDVVDVRHEYAASGDYLISFNPGDHGTLGNGVGLLKDGIARTYLRKAYVWGRCSSKIFNGCCNLETLTIPYSTAVTQIWADPFNECFRLKHLNVPSQMTGASDRLVCRAHGMRTISLPFGFSGGGWATFMETGSLRRLIMANFKSAGTQFLQQSGIMELIIPESLTNIPANMLASCFGLYKLKFYSTTPPTVANANAFNYLPAACIVEVPAESLEAYQNATNYGNIAAQMVGV